MQVGDGLIGFVDQHVMTAGIDATIMGINIHIDLHVSNFRLRQVNIFPIQLLVVCLALFRDVPRDVLIQHIGVVENPAAKGCKSDKRRRKQNTS